MADYKKMYTILFNTIADVIEALKTVTAETENIYIESTDITLELGVKGTDDKRDVNITNLTTIEITAKLMPYLTAYFEQDIRFEEDLFSESYLFLFEEVSHLIPEQYHEQYRQKLLRGFSGTFHIDTKEYALSLLVDEGISHALFLYLHDTESEKIF